MISVKITNLAISFPIRAEAGGNDVTRMQAQRYWANERSWEQSFCSYKFFLFFRRQRLLSTPNGSQNGCHIDESLSKLITPYQVSYREQIDNLVNNQPPFVGGQLKFHVESNGRTLHPTPLFWIVLAIVQLNLNLNLCQRDICPIQNKNFHPLSNRPLIAKLGNF